MRKKQPKQSNPSKDVASKDTNVNVSRGFQLEFLTSNQKLAWEAFQENDILFLVGPAGTGKSMIASAFGICEVLKKTKEKLVLTRPIVEAGEKLGFLPGSFEEKVNPYMLPLYDSMDKICGKVGPQREHVQNNVEVAPIAFMRGREQPHSSLLYTPDGYKIFGEIKTGDKVFGSNGQPITVTGVYPKGKKQIYKVIFSDHTEVRCGAEHLWSTMTINEKRSNKGFTTKTTEEIINSTIVNKWGQKNHRIPLLSAPVEFASQEITVNPYLLGLLIGDGHIRRGYVGISSTDEFIINECKKIVSNNNLKLTQKNQYDYAFVKNMNQGNNQLLKQLYELNLSGKKSLNKFVPDIYKYNSVEVRLEVLRGLLDSDGTIGKHRSGKCRIQFSSISKQLSDDVMFLVRSLGGYAYSRKREFIDDTGHKHKNHMVIHRYPCYIIDIVMPNFNPFKLPRKADLYINDRTITKFISKIIPDGEEECSCISVNSPDKLYVTDNFVLTHNTFENSVFILDEAQNCTYSQLKLAITRIGKNTKMIITGDPEQSDLYGDVSLSNLLLKLRGVDGVGIIMFDNKDIVRHPILEKILAKI